MRTVFILLTVVLCQNNFAQQVVANAFSGKIAINNSSAAAKLSDIDGNIYNTVKIGNQVWMAENLKTTKYSDGKPIPLIDSENDWEILTPTCEAYCWYNDDITYKEKYGALYTWAAAMNNAASSSLVPSGVQGACPAGWHLPSDEEWTILTDYLANNGYGLGSNGIAIGKSMAASSDWNEFKAPGTVGNNLAINNRSGFAALPGGSRLFNGEFNQAGYTGNWWRSTEYSLTLATFRYISYSNSRMYRSSNNKQNGFSVRCLKDYRPLIVQETTGN